MSTSSIPPFPSRKGGRRPGAGRKPIAGKTMKRYTIRLTEKQVRFLNTIADAHNLSEAIRIILDAAEIALNNVETKGGIL